METMKAFVYKGDEKLVLEQRPRPHILEPEDVIVKVTLTAICSSDLHIKHGAVPKTVNNTVLGHEFVGIVCQAGKSVKKFKPGDRVAVNVETFCGDCFFCRQGFVNNCICENGGWALGCRIDGGQAEYARVPYGDNGLTLIPDSVSDEAALFTGDLLSTGYWAARMGEVKPADQLAVIGAGPAGLCTMMCARLYSPSKIIAIDTCQERLALAAKYGWADEIVNPQREAPLERILELTGGRGADVVFEAAGVSTTFALAWKCARPNAIVGIVAMYEENQILPLPSMYGKNLTFKTGGVDANACGQIMELIACGKLNAAPLITHRATLDQISQAYENFEKRANGVIKYAISV